MRVQATSYQGRPRLRSEIEERDLCFVKVPSRSPNRKQDRVTARQELRKDVIGLTRGGVWSCQDRQLAVAGGAELQTGLSIQRSSSTAASPPRT
jgi:hypothetical protein